MVFPADFCESVSVDVDAAHIKCFGSGCSQARIRKQRSHQE